MKFKLNLYYLFFVFICTLPFQTRYFFYRPMIDGTFFEYAGISLYIMDILFLILMVFFSISNRKTLLNKLTKQWKFIAVLAIFEVTILLSIFVAEDKALAWYGYIRIVEGMLLALFMNISSISQLQFASAWMISAIIPSILGIEQFFAHRVFGSTILGMSFQEASQKGVSVVEVGGERFLRAYGTFPHPNVFGGFLVIALISTVYVYFHTVQKNSRAMVLTIFGLELVALFFSLSRSAWLAFFLGFFSFLLAYSYFNKKNVLFISVGKRILISTLCISGILTMIYFPLVQTRFIAQERIEQQSITVRISQIQEAISMFVSSPIGGVGIFQYTKALMDLSEIPLSVWEYQPVHNMYLLMASELGIIGLFAFLFLIMYVCTQVLQNSAYQLSLFFIIIILAFFDHYFWTLPSAIFMFWIVLGMANMSDRKNIDVFE